MRHAFQAFSQSALDARHSELGTWEPRTRLDVQHFLLIFLAFAHLTCLIGGEAVLKWKCKHRKCSARKRKWEMGHKVVKQL